MLKQVSVSNVRIFDRGPHVFPIAPLTVFCGANSAGKSTVMKVLLLLQQNFGLQRDSLAAEGVLRASGKSVDMGDFQTLVSMKEMGRTVRIELINEDTFESSVLTFLPDFLADERISAISAQTKGKYISYQLKSEFTFVERRVLSDPDSLPVTYTVDGAEPIEREENDDPSQGILSGAKFEITIGEVSILRWDVSASVVPSRAGADVQQPVIKYTLSLPEKFFSAAGGDRLIEKAAPNERGYASYEVTMDGISPILLVGKELGRSHQKRKSKTRKNEDSGPRVPITLPPLIGEALRDLRRALTRIQYLGPLRSPGRRFYVLSPELASELDPVGEFLPYILRDRRDEQVSYCSPGNLTAAKRGTLASAVNEWLYFLKNDALLKSGAKDEFESRFNRHVLGELKMRGPGAKTYALADTGFGYSQVLPVIARGLLCPANSTFIVEQPELHLHPALQIRLASFFVGLANSRKVVLLETHSEHLVNAIRVLVAEDETSALASKTRIFYVDSKDGAPFIHDLSVRSDGSVPNWPRSFFGEGISLTGRLLRAQKKRTNQNEIDSAEQP